MRQAFICLPFTIFRYDATEELCCFNNYYDPPLMAGQSRAAFFEVLARQSRSYRI
jgi:hypothetical protein